MPRLLLKTPLVLLAALAVATTSAFAQKAPAALAAAPVALKSPPRRPPPAKPAPRGAQKPAPALGLSPEQQSQAHALLLAERQALLATRANTTSTDRQALHQIMRASHATYDAQLRALLTPGQYAKYAQLEARRRA